MIPLCTLLLDLLLLGDIFIRLLLLLDDNQVATGFRFYA